MFTIACCSVVGFGLGLALGLGFGVGLVSGYAHVFMLLSVVIVTVPLQVNGVLDVKAVQPYLLLSTTSATLSTQSGTTAAAVITEHNVAVETNVIYDTDSDVRFTVITEPVHGEVELLADDGHTRQACRRFTVADVRHRLVVYRRNSDVVDSVVGRDRFVVVVGVDGLQTTGVVEVDLRPPPPRSTPLPPPGFDVGGSMTASVDELADVVLTSAHLSVVVTSHPVVPADIRYDVTEQPERGALLTVRGVPVRTFTQADVDAGLLLYRHRRVGGNATDYFRFRVRHLGDSDAVSDEYRFVIDVMESIIPLTATNLTIIEGQSTFVDATTLQLGARYRDSVDVLFTVLQQPSHGRLEAADRPGVRLTQFSTDQLTPGAMRYTHNGDEEPTDNFTVTAWLTTPPERRTPPTTIHVDVVGVNDQRPTIVVNVVMQVWTGNYNRQHFAVVFHHITKFIGKGKGSFILRYSCRVCHLRRTVDT